jgi:hypothetical protein
MNFNFQIYKINHQYEPPVVHETTKPGTYHNIPLIYHMLEYSISGKQHQELLLSGNTNHTLFNTMGECVESVITANKQNWESYHVSSPFELDIIPYERFKRIRTERHIKHTAHVTTINTKAFLKQHGLNLNTHGTCICEETGISYLVDLPCPFETILTLVHPLAYFHNVQEMIRKYQRHGIPITGLERQVLAGMLITILKHKDWITCKDAISANKRLQQVNKRTLGYAIWYFYKSQERFNLPKFNILDTGNPTQQLIQFLQICRGEDDTVEVFHMKENVKNKIKAKLYTNIEDKEAAQLRDDIKSCNNIIDRLHKAKPDVSMSMLELINQRIKRLGVLSDAEKTNLSNSIYEVFGETDNTKAIALIIRSVNTDTIQKSLLTFSMELESDIQDWQANKADMLAQLKGIKDGN